MVFLHYPALDQINWCSLVDACPLTIVVAPVTFRELQRHKDAGRRRVIRKRAAKAIDRLTDWLRGADEGQELRPGVSIQLDNREPELDFASHGLVKDVQDDRLIASAISWRAEHRNSRVVIATQDKGLLLTAKAGRQGIEAIELPGNLRLPAERDPLAQEHAELQRKISELENALPQLKLSFADGTSWSEFTIAHEIPVDESRIAAAVRAARDDHPLMSDPSKPPPRARPTGGDRMVNPDLERLLDAQDDLRREREAMQWTLGPTPAEIGAYNGALEDYYELVRDHQRTLYVHRNKCIRTLELRLLLCNSGTATGEDIEVHLVFPERIKVGLRLPEGPTEPRPPVEPRGVFDIGAVPVGPWDGLGWNLPGAGAGGDDFFSRVSFLTGHKLSVVVGDLKHGLGETIEPLYATLPSHDDLRSFNIDYEMFVRNVPRVVTGKLNVKVSLAGG